MSTALLVLGVVTLMVGSFAAGMWLTNRMRNNRWKTGRLTPLILH